MGAISPRSMAATGSSTTLPPRGTNAIGLLYTNRHGRSPQSRAAPPFLERVHDLRVVRAPALQEGAAVDRDPGQLGHRSVRVLPAGAGQPDREPRAIGLSAEGDAG